MNIRDAVSLGRLLGRKGKKNTVDRDLRLPALQLMRARHTACDQPHFKDR